MNGSCAPQPGVTFGEDIKRPAYVRARPLGEILDGIRDGEWKQAVDHVRSLPYDSVEQKEAKARLPYFTPAGEFSCRDSKHLICHSGLFAADLDGLTEFQISEVMRRSRKDQFCFAAFTSARGRGVCLLIRVPSCGWDQHRSLCDQVATHVRGHYQLNLDPQGGQDVCRARFVSWDPALWVNPDARPLPVTLPPPKGKPGNVTQRYRCVTTTGKKGPRSRVVGQPRPHSRGLRPGTGGTAPLDRPWWVTLGIDRAPYERKPDGTFLTHDCLLALGKDLAGMAAKCGKPLEWWMVEEAFHAWYGDAMERGRLRGTEEDYLEELRDGITSIREKPWFQKLIDVWLRWTRADGFPSDGTDDAKLLYAIRSHCREAKTDRFFLSSRDAATILGKSHMHAWRVLKKLVRKGHLKESGNRGHARHAQTFRLA